MKNISIFFIILLISTAAIAKKVKFAVDLSGLTVNPLGVHVAGNFQVLAGFGTDDWISNTTPLSQEGSSNIYSIIVDIPAFSSYEFKFIGKYPFNEHTSLRGSIMYRRDELLFLSTDSFSLNIPNFYADNFGYRLEYVYDNTVSKGLNLFNGTRYKIYVEQFKEIGVNNDGIIDLIKSFGKPTQNMVNIGFSAKLIEGCMQDRFIG